MMQRRYTLPVSALLQTLTGQNGLIALSARLASVPGYPSQAGEVTLILGQGRIHTCTIRARNGPVLMQGGEALKRLEQLGSLEWQVEGISSSWDTWQTTRGNGSASSWSQEPVTQDQRMPCRRVAALAPTQQQALSHRQRQVFALADGSRSVADIALLLHLSPDEVVRLLHTLRHEQLID